MELVEFYKEKIKQNQGIIVPYKADLEFGDDVARFSFDENLTLEQIGNGERKVEMTVYPQSLVESLNLLLKINDNTFQKEQAQITLAHSAYSGGVYNQIKGTLSQIRPKLEEYGFNSQGNDVSNVPFLGETSKLKEMIGELSEIKKYHYLDVDLVRDSNNRLGLSNYVWTTWDNGGKRIKREENVRLVHTFIANTRTMEEHIERLEKGLK